ncbi:uncharacterized protein LOC109545340 isoform X2 [Dendroctonus ponderosae]|uniref:Neuropeptide-like 1 n=1 Tax=Dendroctonus ponderosae TaxID=77166 RepID=A0AAR5QEC7_DENPD|nr:uncharacterized protein LOC109545340 isoform X2 [Dendroctonus ponderosae]
MGNLRLINLSVWCVLVGCALIDNKVKSDNSCDLDIPESLRILLDPQETDSIQVQALRRQLLRKLQLDCHNLELAELEDAKNYKSLASLAGWGNIPAEHKRNLEALARAGTWYKNPPEIDQSEDANYKRSMEVLLKNGPAPLMPESLENQKRIESLARNGDFLRRQPFQSFLNSQDYKRNIASLARAYSFPVGSTAGFGKRSIGSIARNGNLPYFYGKRNIQSLARDGALGKRSADYMERPADKRNIQSIKAQQRNKRQADYFENELVYQMPADYEDILQDLAASQDAYPVEDKRFLGSVAKSGWFRPVSRSYSSWVSLPEKRHVAALARLGWLPTYRSVRRFNRSGRSYLRSNTEDIVCRPNPPNGKTENNRYTKVSSVPLENKRYLGSSTVNNVRQANGIRPPIITRFV